MVEDCLATVNSGACPILNQDDPSPELFRTVVSKAHNLTDLLLRLLSQHLIRLGFPELLFLLLLSTEEGLKLGVFRLELQKLAALQHARDSLQETHTATITQNDGERS